MAETRTLYLAEFALHMNIRPWEWDRLTRGEALALMGAIDQMRRNNAAQEAQLAAVATAKT